MHDPRKADKNIIRPATENKQAKRSTTEKEKKGKEDAHKK